LKDIGFSFDKEDNLISSYDEKTASDILNKVTELKKEGIISSRGNDKYQIKIHLDKDLKLKGKIKKFNKDSASSVNYPKSEGETTLTKKTRRQNSIKNSFFGGNLSLKKSITNDVYLDIVDLDKYYEKNKNKLSNTFPNLIRMALRLLIDSAQGEQTKDIKEYIKANFSDAKSKLTQDQKTTLSNQNVNGSTLTALLHTSAHNYSNSSNMEQTIAISIVIGEMLKSTHGNVKDKKQKSIKP
jgi:hypothetical protein